MKAASISELKKELAELPPGTLLEVCIRLAKYKKENKELVTYLLFEEENQARYIQSIKNEIDLQFSEINKSNMHFIKKSLRKILRIANKYIKYSGNRQTEIEILVYYCDKLKSSGIAFRKNTSLLNIYNRQIQKIKKAIATLHEDLQYDYEKGLDALSDF